MFHTVEMGSSFTNHSSSVVVELRNHVYGTPRNGNRFTGEICSFVFQRTALRYIRKDTRAEVRVGRKKERCSRTNEKMPYRSPQPVLGVREFVNHFTQLIVTLFLCEGMEN